ncbi:hypothetical protein, partial [Yersinia enterocolitica]
RHSADLIELVEQSVDHKTLCLFFFTRPLLGIPQGLIARSISIRLSSLVVFPSIVLMYEVKISQPTEVYFC